MYIDIRDKEAQLRKGIQAYCDERGISCGVDDRRLDSEGVIEYIFFKYGGKGFKVTLQLHACGIVRTSLVRIYDTLNTYFTIDTLDSRRTTVKNEIAEYKWLSKYNIEKVIFNNPATIVFWEDGTKTVVKRQKGDRWDKEKGLAMAIAKKLYGNTGKYCDILKEHLED